MDYVQPQQETSISSGDFNLRYRSVELRFIITKAMLYVGKEVRLRCIATIPGYPKLTRQRSEIVNVVTAEHLTNQKWVGNSGKNILI